MSDRSFPSKVLLFGEYSVIKSSNALAIPYGLFEGKLVFKRQNEGTKDPELRALSSHLKKLDNLGELPSGFDVSSFDFDVGQGLVFDSSIPQGYGVGSSGALVAAIYDRYCQSVESNEVNIEALKRDFSLIEGHFHGSSSGFDPLVSYLNSAILNELDKGLTPMSLKANKSGEGAIFLLNTGRSRKTEPLVNLFLEKCKSEEFSILCERELNPVTNNCIDSFLSNELQSLWDNFTVLSQFQYKHFSPMIPKLYHDLWREGLDQHKYLLKLCGAGGGGFLMGMTRNFKECSKSLSDFEIRSLIRI